MATWQDPEDESQKDYVSDYQSDMTMNGNVITGTVYSNVNPSTYRTYAAMVCNTEESDSIGSMPEIIGRLINGETPGGR